VRLSERRSRDRQGCYKAPSRQPHLRKTGSCYRADPGNDWEAPKRLGTRWGTPNAPISRLSCPPVSTPQMLDSLSTPSCGSVTRSTLGSGHLNCYRALTHSLRFSRQSRHLDSLSTPYCGRCNEIHGRKQALELLQSSHTFTPILAPVSPQISCRCYRALLWSHAAQNCFLVLRV
jgi:hypothetical protein